MSKKIDVRSFVDTMHSTSVAPLDRAQTLTYMVHELGLDVVPGIEQLLKEADQGRLLKDKAEQDQRTPLCCETYLGSVHFQGRLHAVVTMGHTDTYLPCKAEDIAGLEMGDAVLVDAKNGTLAGPNGQIPSGGELVKVECVPDDSDYVYVQYGNDVLAARLALRMRSGLRAIEPGDRVVYDPVRRVVKSFADARSDGSELLTSVSELDPVTRSDLGAAHPILDEMLFRVKLLVEHPEWVKKMGVRMCFAYLLVGPTGTGKTMHINVLARETAAFIEGLTGEQNTRLVILDAASFYDPYLGVSENRIKSVYARLRTLAAKALKSKDGRELKIPLIVVLEECEALFRTRGEFGGSAHLFDRLLSLILQQMSSVGNQFQVPVIFIATTNLPNLLDPAARRRFGMRQAIFSTLGAGQAASVLDKKIHADLPLRNGRGEPSRQDVFNQVLSYLYSDHPAQGVAEVQMQDGTKRTLCRRDVVTGGLLEAAVSTATDASLRESAAVGRLLGLDGEAIIRALHGQFVALAATLRPHNLGEHCPHWLNDESIRVLSVRALAGNSRRPRSTLIH